MTDRGQCRECGKDCSLTKDGRIRRHGSGSPGGGMTCPGGGEFPEEGPPTVTEVCPGCGCPGHAGFCEVCGCLDDRERVTASGGPNPWRSPLPDHTHRYEWGDDGNGHSGSFCTVCEQEEPAGYQPPFRRHGHTGEHLPMHSDNTTEEPCPIRSTPPNPPAAPDPDRSSPPVTTVSASTATEQSTKVNSSAPTETDSRTRSASMTDDFESAAPPRVRSEQKVERNGWGQYLLIHPATGKKQAWQRVTTFVKMLEDNFGLGQWQQRMLAKGLSMRPDLLDLIGTLDVKNDREQLNKLLEQARDVAGQKVAANVGTTVHKHTEEVDLGGPLDDVPPRYRPDVAAYLETLRTADLTIVPHLIERITVVPDLQVGGTFDRVVRDRSGKYRVLDVKTGNMDFGQLAICMQLALYAYGVNEVGVYDLDNGVWEPDPLSRFADPGTKVETDYGLVAHIVPGSAYCDLLQVPIDAGWKAVQTAAAVRDWRKQKRLFTAYAPGGEPTQVRVSSPVRPPTWSERFGAASTRAEASALYTEAVKALGTGSADLQDLVKVTLARLTSGQ